MEIQVVDLSGEALTLQAEASDTIKMVKGKIREAVSLPKVQTLQLIFEGQSLADADTLSKCNVQAGSTLQVVYQMRENHADLCEDSHWQDHHTGCV